MVDFEKDLTWQILSFILHLMLLYTTVLSRASVRVKLGLKCTLKNEREGVNGGQERRRRCEDFHHPPPPLLMSDPTLSSVT